MCVSVLTAVCQPQLRLRAPSTADSAAPALALLADLPSPSPSVRPPNGVAGVEHSLFEPVPKPKGGRVVQTDMSIGYANA